MHYRNLPRPDLRSLLDTMDWVAWGDSEHLLPPIAPVTDPACSMCHGAVGWNHQGQPFTCCQHCRGYRLVLDGVVPIVYSLSDGLESLLHRYKDFGPEHRWMGCVLASVLFEFLDRHLKCVADTYGHVDRVVTVPGGNSARDFDHLADAVRIVTDWPFEWEFDLVRKVKPGRPGRGEVNPDYYRLAPGRDVTGQVVLLVDDTWTSGGTLASVAARLRGAGAKSVVGLTVGRQLHPNWGTADALISTARTRAFAPDLCVICG